MEGLLFLIILVVASLLRGKARQGRQPPPPRPRRPVLDPEREESREDTDFFPPERPARKRVTFDDSIFRFPGREPDKPRARREKPPEVKDHEIKAPGRVKRAAVRFPQAGQGKLQNLFFEDREELARGIILTEVLGPPLSKRKKRGFV